MNKVTSPDCPLPECKAEKCLATSSHAMAECRFPNLFLTFFQEFQTRKRPDLPLLFSPQKLLFSYPFPSPKKNQPTLTFLSPQVFLLSMYVKSQAIKLSTDPELPNYSYRYFAAKLLTTIKSAFETAVMYKHDTQLLEELLEYACQNATGFAVVNLSGQMNNLRMRR